MKRDWLAFALIGCSALAVGIGCNREQPAAPDPIASSPADKPVDVAALQFDTPELKARFQSLNAVVREFAAKEQGWVHRDYTMGGNFLTAVWAKGAGFDGDCRLDRVPEHQVGTHKIEVDTIVVGERAKSAAVTTEQTAEKPNEWSVLCHYREATEQGVTGAGWGVTFFEWDASKLKSRVPFRPYEQTTAKITLGPRYIYGVQETSLEVSSDLPLAEDFLRYLKSPESMRDSYLRAAEELARRVEDTIASHKAKKRVFGKYAGDGRPPPSYESPLTAEEEADELAKARTHFAQQERLIKEHYQEMHAALRQAFPFEKCWPLTPQEK